MTEPSIPVAKALAIISRAWGKQDGYVFFPHIDREEQIRTGKRRAGYHENRAFKWPQEKSKILAHMKAHTEHDLYWCPSIFEGPDRQYELAMDEHALWADLDEADPKKLKGNQDFKPTIAWESSPGRFQGLWLGNPALGDFEGASRAGGENQRLSYFLEADRSGWDTTQLLRIPGWPNHKPEYRKNGKTQVVGKLLWERGPMYEMDDFKALPEVKGAVGPDQLGEVIEAEIEGIDRHAVIGRIKLKLNQRARDLLSARDASGPQGSRGDNLWYLIRCIADAGCTVQEIVAVVKGTVWNKFEGRGDEIKRLITEATKAIQQRSPEAQEALEEESAPKPKPQRLAAFLKDVKPPTWLVEGIATEGSVGFIAGAPKSFKSWFALDFSLSVATGADFLDYFRVVRPGPVLYIQEEDSAITVKSRSRKIWRGKTVDKMRLMNNGKDVLWIPGDPNEFDPDIDIYCMEGFVASDPGWQEWLDETLAAGMDGRPYVLVIIDTLMNVAGDVEENKSQQLTTRIFKPMKVLMRKHSCALRFVHHMGKGGDENRRGGQKLLGATALHAWAEDSLYITRTGKPGQLKVEFESKSAPEEHYLISGLDNKLWTPIFEPPESARDTVPTARSERRSTPKDKTPRVPKAQQPLLDILSQGGSFNTADLATQLKASYHPTYRTLNNMLSQGLIAREGKAWKLL